MYESKIIDNSYDTVYDAVLASENMQAIEWFDSVSEANSSFKTCKTFLELNKKVIATFPFASEEYYNFRYLVFEPLYLKPLYKHEYVVAWTKVSPFPNNADAEFFSNLGHFNDTYRHMLKTHKGDYTPQLIHRYEAEYNPEYVHLVVGALPYTSDGKYVLMKRKYGTYKDSLTLVEGHISYNEWSTPGIYRMMMPDLMDLNKYAMSELIRRETSRELAEEIGAHVVSIWDEDFESIYYQPPIFISPTDISYFHAGFLTKVMIEESSDEIKSMEPDKNDVVIFTPEELARITLGQTDVWLYNFIQARIV